MKYILILVLIAVAIYLIIRFWAILLTLAALSLAGAAIVKYFRDKQAKTAEEAQMQKENLFELLLCLFLGWAGAHKFYRKKKGWGIAYLLTLGLACAGWWGDLIQLCHIYFSGIEKSNISVKRKVGSYAIAFLCALVLGSCGANNQSDKTAELPTTPTQTVTENTNEETSIPETATIPTEAISVTEATSAVEETTEPTEIQTVPATEPVTEPATEPVTEPATEPVQTEPVGTRYILNTNTGKFHYPSCSSAKKIKASNRGEITASREEVIAKGYSPCGQCHP